MKNRDCSMERPLALKPKYYLVELTNKGMNLVDGSRV